MLSLPSLIERAARLNPNGIATHYAGRERKWAELAGRVSSLASGLAGFGAEAGERIAILSLNSDRYYESIFAISWAGYCVVPLNTRWAVPENEYALTDSGSRVLMFDDAFAEQAKTLLADCEQLQGAVYMGEGECPEWASAYESLIDENGPAVMSSRGGDDMAGIFYTGGTTGFPKGVMQSHGAIWASAMGALPTF
jgi:acyl-CoA synthetase (AMP-forming)/AMP-acid ligase II